jgi:hypothetical protein
MLEQIWSIAPFTATTKGTSYVASEQKQGTAASGAVASEPPASFVASCDEQDAVGRRKRQASRANDRARVAAARVRTAFIVAAAARATPGSHTRRRPMLRPIHRRSGVGGCRPVRTAADARIESRAGGCIAASAFGRRRSRVRWAGVGVRRRATAHHDALCVATGQRALIPARTTRARAVARVACAVLSARVAGEAIGRTRACRQYRAAASRGHAGSSVLGIVAAPVASTTVDVARARPRHASCRHGRIGAAVAAGLVAHPVLGALSGAGINRTAT